MTKRISAKAAAGRERRSKAETAKLRIALDAIADAEAESCKIDSNVRGNIRTEGNLAK